MNINKAHNFIHNDERISSSGTLMNIDLKSLADAGYEAVINLLPDDDNRYAISGEKDRFDALGIDYSYIPVDWEAPTRADFDAFESAMISTKEKKLHIHCAANYRATGFYAIYAYKHLDWSKDKIYEFTGAIWQIAKYPTWVKFIDEITSEH